MLTRLKVSGFKNLVDVDVRFGPFTCIAGGNAVGKSNLFDAIRFLSDLAHKPLQEAALSVRGEDGKLSDIRDLFHHANGKHSETMSFEVEMITSATGKDFFGHKIEAPVTFFRYKLVLGYRTNDKYQPVSALEVIEELLTPLALDDAKVNLEFLRENDSWIGSVVLIKDVRPLVLIKENNGQRIFVFPRDYSPGENEAYTTSGDMIYTGLSFSRFQMSDMATLVCQEMQSWRVFDWEPSALRAPSSATKPLYLGADGSQLAAAIYRIAQNFADGPPDVNSDEREAEQMYQFFANRLSALIGGVHRLRVDYEEASERYTLWITGRDGAEYNARSLSDGTLRFLAYLAFVFDEEAKGVLCFEEPENGIHPERITALLEVFQDIVVDVNEPVAPDNPLRQVIISTHSPGIAQQVSDDSLLIAQLREMRIDDKKFNHVIFEALPDTWRTMNDEDANRLAPGKLLPYFNPSPYRWAEEDNANTNTSENGNGTHPTEPVRVMDRADLQFMAPWGNRKA